MLPVLRRTWAPCGVTPTLSVRTRSHEKVSEIGALIVSPRRRQLTLTLALHARLNIRGPQVLRFLRHLARHVRGPVVLVWDRGLLFFIAFLVVRVPTFRDAMEKFFADVAKGLLRMSAAHPEYFERTIRQALQGKEDDLTPEKIEQYRRFMLDDSKYNVMTSPKLSLSTGFEVVLDTIYPVFDKMRWVVVRSPGISGFITSDTRVSWVDPTIPFPYAMGLVMPKTEVTFPIDPSTCVLGTWEGSTAAITADDKTVSDYNFRRVMFASRYAFAVTEQAKRGCSSAASPGPPMPRWARCAPWRGRCSRSGSSRQPPPTFPSGWLPVLRPRIAGRHRP